MADIGVYSYGAGALAFLVLSTLLLTSWRGRLQGALLVSAVGASLAWSVAAAYEAGSGYPTSIPVIAGELLRDWLWALFLVRLIESPRRDAAPPPVFRALVYLVHTLPLLLLFIVGYLSLTGNAALSWLGYDARVLGMLTFSVLLLVLIEQLFRNTDADRRWAVKFLCFGLGAIFAYDFYLYADASLFKQIDTAAWEARGFINAIAVPLIGITAARNPQWSVDVSVSRTVVFHTTAVAGAGVYLLSMAVGGYYIRYYGGEVGAVVKNVFLVGAVLLLLALLFSGHARARVKVFFNKHFFNYRYDYREEWLRFIRTLSVEKSRDTLYERAIRAIAAIIDSPGGILFQRQGDGHYAAVRSVNARGTHAVESAHGSLARFLGTWQWVINLDEYKRERQLYQELELPEWLTTHAQAWLVVPLMVQSTLFGFMVLARSRAPRDFNWEDIDLLKTVGRQVAIHLAQAEADAALMEARQFEAFNRLSAYVVHDLKNLVAQLSLVVSNAKKHKGNPAFMDDAIATVDNAVARMNRLLTQLRSGQRHDDRAHVALAPLLRTVAAEKGRRAPAPQLDIATGLESVAVLASRERLATVVGHLVQNAQEATSDTGRVWLRLRYSQGRAMIEVQDTGCGMDEAFIRERLFRPFDTTKGLTGMGIGVYEAREYVQSLGGLIEVSSQPQQGSLFRVSLPAIEAEPSEKAVANDNHH